MTISTVTAFSGFTDKAPASPTYFNSKFSEVYNNLDALNAAAAYDLGIYNVKNPTYGAKGDGSTDDASAIQAAITAAPAGSMVFLPSGTYSLSTFLNITKPLSFVGSGWSSVLKLASAASSMVILAENTTSGISGLRLAHFAVDGNRTGLLDSGLLQLNNCVGFQVDNLWVKNGGPVTGTAPSGVNGIAVSAGGVGNPGSQGVIRDCLVEENSKAGINWTTEAINGLIIGNISRSNSGNSQAPGIQVNGGWNCTVMGNSVYSNEGVGIYVATSGTTPPTLPLRCKVIGNTVYQNGRGVVAGSGIHAANSATTADAHIQIIGNSCYSNGLSFTANGIEVDNFTDVLIAGNDCYENTVSGCDISSSGNILVSGNRFTNNGAAGTGYGLVLGSVRSFTVIGNHAYDTRSAATQTFGIYLFNSNNTFGVIADNLAWPNASSGISSDKLPNTISFYGNRTGVGANWQYGDGTGQNVLTLDPTGVTTLTNEFDATSGISSRLSLNLNQGRFLSMRTLPTSSLTPSAGNTNVAANELVLLVGGASGASLAIHSGGTIYIFHADSTVSAKAT